MSTEPAGGGVETVPVCPRHPDRESYVRCQRCERPVCPECQRPAAVGVQCVDCVREQNKGMRTARTAFGGTPTAGRPMVTQTIIGICVAVYLLQWTAGGSFTNRFSFAPPLALAEPWRFVTSAFLHSPGSVLHILFNMYALWLTGPYLEQVLGRARFVALYLLAAVGGSVFYLLLASPGDPSSWFSSAVGASGAVFGLFAALFVVNRKLGLDSRGILVLIGINTAIGFVPGFNIAWQAHLGGLVTGALAAAVLANAPRDRRTQVQVAGLVVVGVLLLGLVAAKVVTVPAELLA